MKNALILHGTDFAKTGKQRENNWFSWLKRELEELGYQVWLPELPEAWQPDLERYWRFLEKFSFNQETVLVGHSSGGTAAFGILHKLPAVLKVHLAISVSGFYHDEGWGCEGLFREGLDWEKIRKQAAKVVLLWSSDDPYISKEQTDGLAERLNVEPIVFQGKKHFNLEAGEEFRKFPELLELIKSN